MANCSSSCATQDHATFGECVRAKNIKAQWLGGTGTSLGREKAFQRENERFRSAVRQGVQPDAVSNRAIDRAMRAADAQG